VLQIDDISNMTESLSDSVDEPLINNDLDVQTDSQESNPEITLDDIENVELNEETVDPEHPPLEVVSEDLPDEDNEENKKIVNYSSVTFIKEIEDDTITNRF
jgi:hypothetical protein